MKSILVLAVFTTLTLGLELIDEDDSFLRSSHDNCNQENNIPVSYFLGPRSEYQNAPPALVQYWHCLARQYGFISDEGHFDRNTIYDSLENIRGFEDAQNILDKCAVEMDSPSIMAYKFWYCLEDEGLPYMKRITTFYMY